MNNLGNYDHLNKNEKVFSSHSSVVYRIMDKEYNAGGWDTIHIIDS